ncbi:MAG TPA: GAF domain-containing protein [Candidatus Krumholzibacterium sp.]|nr:GAF domain-containing protein [Candidatus Krumholzibacterium sp.]
MIDKKAIFDSIRSRLDSVIDGPDDRDCKLQAICDLLREKVDYYDWVGFYLTVPGTTELALGPFNGASTDHTCIPFGKGVCGQAAAKKRTIIIDNVAEETNYLSCSPDVKSEIVVPILKGDQVLGEIDIDSHDIAPYSSEDTELLEHIAKELLKLW